MQELKDLQRYREAATIVSRSGLQHLPMPAGVPTFTKSPTRRGGEYRFTMCELNVEPGEYAARRECPFCLAAFLYGDRLRTLPVEDRRVSRAAELFRLRPEDIKNAIAGIPGAVLKSDLDSFTI